MISYLEKFIEIWGDNANRNAWLLFIVYEPLDIREFDVWCVLYCNKSYDVWFGYVVLLAARVSDIDCSF